MLYEILVVLSQKAIEYIPGLMFTNRCLPVIFQIFLVAIHSRHRLGNLENFFILGFHLLNCILSSCTSVSMHNPSWLDFGSFFSQLEVLLYKADQSVCICVCGMVCAMRVRWQWKEKTTYIILYGTVFP